MVYLLAAAGAVSLVAGKVFDAAVILLIVLANIVIGVVQEYRAEAALDALRRLSSPRARVLRDREVHVIDASEVVVGDVLVLETGDKVAADARLVSETDLRVDESALTGESEPVDKEMVDLPEETPLADRLTMVFSSTPVVGGAQRPSSPPSAWAPSSARSRMRSAAPNARKRPCSSASPFCRRGSASCRS